MTWVLVEYAKRRALSALARLAMPKTDHSKALHGPATITATKCRPRETPTFPDLRLRAYRLHNRDKKAAERYLDRHAILSKGR